MTQIQTPFSRVGPAPARARPVVWLQASSTGFRDLVSPGRPPARWARAAVLLVLGAIAFNLLITWAGHVWHANPGRYFGEKRVGTLVPVAALVGAGVVCLRVFGRLRPDPFGRFWLWAGVLFVFVGLDDLLRFHETLDRLGHQLLGKDPDDKATDHFDDLIVALYAVPALYLGVRHLPRLLQLRWMVLTLGAAFACFTTMVVLDWAHAPKHVEESFKVVAAVLIFAAVLAATHDPQLEAQLSPGPTTTEAADKAAAR